MQRVAPEQEHFMTIVQLSFATALLQEFALKTYITLGWWDQPDIVQFE
jgi:hypothetical protein